MTTRKRRSQWIIRAAFFAVVGGLAFVAWPLPDPRVDLEAEFLRVLQKGACTAVPRLVMAAAASEGGEASRAMDRVETQQTPCRRILDFSLHRPDSITRGDLTFEEALLTTDLMEAKIHSGFVSIHRSMTFIFGDTSYLEEGTDPVLPVPMPMPQAKGRFLGAANPLFGIRCKIVPDVYGVRRYHLRRLLAGIVGEQGAEGESLRLDAWERRFEECGVEAIFLDDPALEPRTGL